MLGKHDYFFQIRKPQTRADWECSAGVIGLSTALVLSKHKNLNVTVVGKHMPGDYDIEYASPWAGANFMPVGKEGSKLRAFEKASWPEVDRICREIPEAGIHYQECRVYGRKKDEGTAVGIWFQELMKEDPWFKDLMPEVRPMLILLVVLHQLPLLWSLMTRSEYIVSTRGGFMADCGDLLSRPTQQMSRKPTMPEVTIIHYPCDNSIPTDTSTPMFDD